MTTLRDLGLSEYEARVYRSLLATGPTTAKELSRASDVPMGRIYDVLNGLQASEMIRSQNASRPKKYAPIEPETALDRLLEDKRAELEAEMEQYESAVGELAEQLDAGEPTGEQFWTVAFGPEDTVELLTERLAAATNRIVMVAPKPASQFDLGDLSERMADELQTALDRGVDVSILASTDLIEAIPPDVLRRYNRGVMSHPDFEVRATENVAGSFTLLDRTEVCIDVPNPLDPDQAFALIALTDPEFAATVIEEFEPRWETAEPIDLSP